VGVFVSVDSSQNLKGYFSTVFLCPFLEKEISVYRTQKDVDINTIEIRAADYTRNNNCKVS
jgi:hypothetical protein